MAEKTTFPSKELFVFESSSIKKADGTAKIKNSCVSIILLRSFDKSNCAGCNSAELK